MPKHNLKAVLSFSTSIPSSSSLKSSEKHESCSKQYLKNEAAIRRLKESTEKVDQRRSNTSTEDVDKSGRDVAKATVAIARAAMRMLGAPTRVITFFDTYTNFCIGLGRKSLAAYETR
jgi:hypothetical protein